MKNKKQVNVSTRLSTISFSNVDTYPLCDNEPSSESISSAKPDTDQVEELRGKSISALENLDCLFVRRQNVLSDDCPRQTNCCLLHLSVNTLISFRHRGQ